MPRFNMDDFKVSKEDVPKKNVNKKQDKTKIFIPDDYLDPDKVEGSSIMEHKPDANRGKADGVACKKLPWTPPPKENVFEQQKITDKDLDPSDLKEIQEERKRIKKQKKEVLPQEFNTKKREPAQKVTVICSGCKNPVEVYQSQITTKHFTCNRCIERIYKGRR
jgi:hypothetical protein